mgnify:CR=1 FL=1
MVKDKNRKFTDNLVLKSEFEVFEESEEESEPEEHEYDSRGDLIILQLVIGGEN